MNNQKYQLVIKILESDLPQKDKAEIVRFFLLPRNTPVLASIELPEDEDRDDFGPVNQPTPHDLDRKANPEMAAEEDEMGKTLKGVVK